MIRRLRSLALLSLCLAAVAGAQTKDAKPKLSAEEFGRLLERSTNSQTAAPDEVMEHIWCGDVDDATTKQACWAAYQARLAYYKRGLELRAEDFGWQHIASKIIFFMVLGLVTAAMFFAWIQFRRDLKRQDRTVVRRTEGIAIEQEQVISHVEIGKDGLKVSSPVLGVVILALSLGFFFLYVKFVFPIFDTF